jgi:hypothetical protein
MRAAGVVQDHIGGCLQSTQNTKTAQTLGEMNPHEPRVKPGPEKVPPAHRSRIVPPDQFECPMFDIRRRRLGIDGRFSHKPTLYM